VPVVRASQPAAGASAITALVERVGTALTGIMD